MIPQAIASIEHILPRNPSADSQWVKDFSAAEREERIPLRATEIM